MNLTSNDIIHQKRNFQEYTPVTWEEVLPLIPRLMNENVDSNVNSLSRRILHPYRRLVMNNLW